jgi:predicted dehydrogenase
LAGGLLITSPQTAFGSQANSAVSFGIVGTGGRGQYVGTIFVKDPRARLTAICDVFPDRIDQAKTSIPGAAQARVYKDHKELIAQADIDAVLISSPVFLHPEHFEAAVNARKHIYCEKPAGADVAGVRRLMRAAERADKSKTVAFGFQQRLSPEYLTAEQILRSGQLGRMTMMISWWVIGGPPPGPEFKSPYPPEERKLRHWALFRDYSGSPIVEQDCHGVDTLNWFAAAHPMKAVGEGSLRFKMPFGDWTSDQHDIIYTYPNDIRGWLLSIKFTGGYRDVREQFFGTRGVIETSRMYYKFMRAPADSRLKSADDLTDVSPVEQRKSKRDITIDAVEYFLASVVNGKPYSMAKDAAESTLTSLLGRMAYETKREVSWEELLQSA